MLFVRPRRTSKHPMKKHPRHVGRATSPWLPLRGSAVLAIGLAVVAACGGQVAPGAEGSGVLEAGTPKDAAVDTALADSAASDASPPDGADASLDAAPDAPRVDGKCVTAADCDARWSPASVRMCPTSSWSCVAGSCTWECRGGRTCTRDASGCLVCRSGATVETSCPTDPCVEGLLPRDGGWGGMESTCARAFVVDVVRCGGEDVPLRTGETCTLQSLFTGAPRGVLQCGPCQTVLGP